MESNLPFIIVAAVVSTYWFCVMVMSIRSRLKFKTPSGSMPKTRIEKGMWLIWVPTIFAWIAVAWKTNNTLLPVLEAGSLVANIYIATIWLAAVVAVASFGLTVGCWIRMGKNWSMAVRPDKDTELITDGLFSAVRHPIYALSLTLMICTVVAICNWQMIVVAIIHCSMLVLKSWNEEKYLLGVHGQQYLDYLKRTNRFFPSLFAQSAQS